MIKGTYTIYLWSTLLKQIHDLQLVRNHNSSSRKVSGTNISIIILLTTCIESFLYTILLDILLLEKGRQNDKFEGRVIADLKIRLNKASWTELENLTLLITGNKLNALCENSLWQEITILYKIRNKIVHGKNIQKYVEGLDVEYRGQYLNIIGEMKSQKLIAKFQSEIFSNAATDNFTNATKKFIKTIATKLSGQFDFNHPNEPYNLYDGVVDFIESLDY